MKIMLARPQPEPETIGLQHLMICEPLELEYLATVARQESQHDVVIIDMIIEKRPFKSFIDKHQPDILAVTGYITHVHILRQYCRTAKAGRPHCVTVVGGVHAEVVPEDFADAAIDFIIFANAITSFRQIVRSLASGGDPGGAPGVWNAGKPLPALDFSPLKNLHPDRSATARYRHRYYYLFHRPCALIKTSFGCPHSCEFCFCRIITRGHYFARDLDDVMAELCTIEERDIYIVDDDFLISATRVKEFCRKIREAGLDKRFLIYGRTDFIADNQEIIAEFAQCGLRAVIVGLESCNQAELDRYNKRNNIEKNEIAVAVLARLHIDCYATLILGENWGHREFRDLKHWLRRLNLTFVNLQPFTPLPGTAPFAKYQDKLRIARADFAKWDLAHLVLNPGRMSPRRFYWNILRLYLATALRPKHVLALMARFGPAACLRLLGGTQRVAVQYLRKCRPGSDTK